ncbi:MAG: hypothetical protein Q8R36_03775 [bacterium]|nr:hypothetical protein [bacterium]
MKRIILFFIIFAVVAMTMYVFFGIDQGMFLNLQKKSIYSEEEYMKIGIIEFVDFENSFLIIKTKDLYRDGEILRLKIYFDNTAEIRAIHSLEQKQILVSEKWLPENISELEAGLPIQVYFTSREGVLQASRIYYGSSFF